MRRVADQRLGVGALDPLLLQDAERVLAVIGGEESAEKLLEHDHLF